MPGKTTYVFFREFSYPSSYMGKKRIEEGYYFCSARLISKYKYGRMETLRKINADDAILFFFFVQYSPFFSSSLFLSWLEICQYIIAVVVPSTRLTTNEQNNISSKKRIDLYPLITITYDGGSSFFNNSCFSSILLNSYCSTQSM
jgi:hypothetical protein